MLVKNLADCKEITANMWNNQKKKKDDSNIS